MCTVKTIISYSYSTVQVINSESAKTFYLPIKNWNQSIWIHFETKSLSKSSFDRVNCCKYANLQNVFIYKHIRYVLSFCDYDEKSAQFS